MPSSIYVNGKSIASPGVYTSVDASGLDVVGQSASGVIGVIGTAVGGTPYTALNGPQDFVSITNPAQGARLFTSGDLLEAVSIAFNPSNDTAIQGGAQQLYAMQVNPSVQATLNLDGSSIILTSQVYGSGGNAVTVTLAAGSASGQMLTISNGSVTEIADNLDNSNAQAVIDWINANSNLLSATEVKVPVDVTGKDILCSETTVSAGDEFGFVLGGNGYGYTAVAGDGPAQILQVFYGRLVGDAASLGISVSMVTVNDSPAVRVLPAHAGAGISLRSPQNVTVQASPTVQISDGTPAALPNMAATPLAGGSDGQATFQDWQNCLNLLKQVRCNTVVVLTTDPAVHAALDAHCTYMCGLGQSERDGFVGIASSQVSGLPTRTEILNALKALNTYNLRACGEQIQRYNSQGVLTTFPTYFTALLAAGMQAGSTPGTSLTRKRINALGVLRDKSWNLVDNKEEMILAGLLFLENKTNVGIRWVRNVTTWTTDNNSAYSDGGVRNALNYAVYNLREAVDFAIGLDNFAGTSNAIVAVASQQLRTLIAENVITAYRALSATADPAAPDSLLLNVQLAPTQPINFVKFTISLATATQIAAAA